MSAAKPTPEPALRYRAQTVVRIIGAVLLTICAVMLVLGMTVLRDRLHGPQFMLYWGWCLLLAFAAIAVAMYDMLMLRRAMKRKRRELFQSEFMAGNFFKKLCEKARDNTPKK